MPIKAVVAINNVARLDMDRTAPCTYVACPWATELAMDGEFPGNHGEWCALVLTKSTVRFCRTMTGVSGLRALAAVQLAPSSDGSAGHAALILTEVIE